MKTFIALLALNCAALLWVATQLNQQIADDEVTYLQAEPWPGDYLPIKQLGFLRDKK